MDFLEVRLFGGCGENQLVDHKALQRAFEPTKTQGRFGMKGRLLGIAEERVGIIDHDQQPEAKRQTRQRDEPQERDGM